MTITISDKNARGIKTRFVLTDEDVDTADFGKSTDASRLLTVFVLKMLAQVEKLDFTDFGKLGKKQVNNIFARVRRLDKGDFSTEEEYKKYQEYMEKLTEKAMKAPVLETMKTLERHFKGKASAVQVFGERKKGSAHKLIDDKNSKFKELSNPIFLGQTYEGIAVQGDDGKLEIKGSGLMQKVDEGRSLYEDDFDKIDEDTDGDTRIIVYDAETYIRDKFTNAGYDISKDRDKEADPAHLVINTDTAEKGEPMLISSEASRFKVGRLEGVRVPVGGGKPATTSQGKLLGAEYYLDALVDSGAEKKADQTRIKAIRIMKDNQVEGTYQSYSEQQPEPTNVKAGDITDAASLAKTCIAKAREIMKDFDTKKMGEYVLAESNLMKPRKTRDRLKDLRGASKRVGDKVTNVPTQAELTMNYRDLDLGTLTLRIEINTEAIVKQFEKIKSASQGDIPLFTVTMQLDKTGELELSGEGAFVSVGKEYVKSMREVVRGVKTFTNATRKFRS